MKGNIFTNSVLTSLVLPDSLFKKGAKGLQTGSLKADMNIYCSKEMEQKCLDYIASTQEYVNSNNGHGVYQSISNSLNLKIYEKDGSVFYYKGKWYQHPNDILRGSYLKKRIYTIEEAARVSKENGNRFILKYR